MATRENVRAQRFHGHNEPEHILREDQSETLNPVSPMKRTLHVSLFLVILEHDLCKFCARYKELFNDPPKFIIPIELSILTPVFITTWL